MNSRVGARGGGWARVAGLARLAGWRPLSTLMGCIHLASDAFVRRAEPNKTWESQSIPNYGTNLEMPFPFVSPISSAGVGSVAALADTMISGGNLP